MTPLNAAQALYSDILDKPTVDREYGLFSGVLERWTQVYYVKDVLAEVLKLHLHPDYHPADLLEPLLGQRGEGACHHG
ncbi:MAG: hypothetical protein II593_07025, partial [Prevotella sp.]|nr:hypothetical protein [Prevotella sp.]